MSQVQAQTESRIMPPRAWNEGMVFIGVYHDIRYYTKDGDIHCCFGWVPQTFKSVKSFKHAVRKWENEDDET